MLAISPALTSVTFAKGLAKVQGKARDQVREFLIDSNEDSIHDLRVSVRRLDALIRLLPNSLRTKRKISNYRSQYKELFKINSEVRDLDIISSKLAKYPARITVSELDSLEQTLQEERSEKLKAARECALAANKLKPLYLGDYDLPDWKLQKRFQKVVVRFAGRIDQRLPVVTSDAEKVKELHELRKDCKKLRYTLEVLNKQPRQNQVVSSMIEYLEDLQNVLGSIHDCDIMIQYLEKTYSDYLTSGGDLSSYHAMLELEQKERMALYHALVDLHSGVLDNRDKRGDIAVPANSGRGLIKIAAAH